jgi:hypothetical protein
MRKSVIVALASICALSAYAITGYISNSNTQDILDPVEVPNSVLEYDGSSREYTIKEVGPSGGVIIYASHSPFPCGPDMQSLCRYVEASPFAAETRLPWAQNEYTSKEVDGALLSAVGSGLSNTRDIVAQGNIDPLLSAAAYADAYEFGGYSDWYLPSRDEIQAIITYREVIGGFTPDLHWSSSQRNASLSWQQHTQQGYQHTFDKSTLAYVRPVRSF